MYKEIMSLKLINAHDALKTAPRTLCQFQGLAHVIAAAAAAVVDVIITLVKK